MSTSPAHRLPWLLCLMFWAISLYLIVLCRIPGPFRDDWEVLPLLEAFFAGQPWLEKLWEPYGNLHRLVITRLLFLFDYRFLGGHNLLQTTASVLLQASTLGLVLWTAHRGGLRGASLGWLALGSSLFLFSAAQFYNLTYAFDNQWFVSTAAAGAALWGLCRYAAEPAQHRLLLVLMFGLLASLGNGAGLSVWPSLLILAWLLKLPVRVHGMLLACLLVIAWLWWPRELLQNSQTLLSQAQLSPWYVLLPAAVLGLGRFFLVLLGNTWSVWSLWIGGLLALSGLVYLVWRLCSLSRQVDSTAGLFLGMALFAVCAAASMTLGRGLNFSEATTSRFFTIPLLFWCGLFADMLWLAWRRWPSRCLPGAVLSLSAALLVLPAYQQELARNTRVSERVRHSLLALGFDLRDWHSINAALSWHMPLNQRNPAQDHKAFFQTWQVGHHGLPLARFRHRILTLPGAVCAPANGSITPTATPGEYSAALHRPEPGTWLIVDTEMRVIGALRLYRPMDWWWPLSWLPDEQKVWRGFAKPEQMPPTHFLRLNTDGEPVCHLPITTMTGNTEHAPSL